VEIEGVGVTVIPQRVLLAIGLLIAGVVLVIDHVFPKYDGGHVLVFPHILILIGFIISIIALIWEYSQKRKIKELHYREWDAPWQWAATSLVVSIGGVLLIVIGTVIAVDWRSIRPLFITGVGFLSVILGIWLARRARKIRVLDSLWPDSYHCPICSHAVNRYERSCDGCGAVVWNEMTLREGTFRPPPEKTIVRHATQRRPGH